MGLSYLNTAIASGAIAVTGSMTWADQVFTDDVIVDSDLLCVGVSCANGEPLIPDRDGMKLKAGNIAIRFVDQSTGFAPDRDWQLNINETFGGGREAFYITDLTSGDSPFWIEGDAPENALYIEDDGDVGLGTMLAKDRLHIADIVPAIRFEAIQGGGYEWRLSASFSGFSVWDVTQDTFPLEIEDGAPDGSVRVQTNGDIGLGTNSPDGKLHTTGDGVQLVYFESEDGGPVQVRFRSDSENRRFLAVDNANNVKSQIIFLDDRINFTGQTDSGPNLWLSIGPNGITSQGPTCGSPCDLTFDPEVFTVPPIAERAQYMWDNMHLPAIGPTSSDQPINLTEKMGGVIHELEVAHIYIEKLHAELAAQSARLLQQDAENAEQSALIATLSARLDALETQ